MFLDNTLLVFVTQEILVKYFFLLSSPQSAIMLLDYKTYLKKKKKKSFCTLSAQLQQLDLEVCVLIISVNYDYSKEHKLQVVGQIRF